MARLFSFFFLSSLLSLCEPLTVTSTPLTVSTQPRTTIKDGASVATPQITVSPDPTFQPGSRFAHTVPVTTLIGTLAGITALFICILLLILCRRRWRHRNRHLASLDSNDNSRWDGYLPLVHSLTIDN